jgi:transcriptional regulator with XRE-family HTH domain
MERGNDWTIRVAAGVGSRVAYHRKQAAMTASALSARCAELGLPLDRNVIAKLETGHRQSVTVDEVFVLAAALDIPPALLLFGVGTEETAEILPGHHVPAFRAAQWASGEGPFPAPDAADLLTLITPPNSGGARPLALYRAHDRAAEEELRSTARATDMGKRATDATTEAECDAFASAADAQRRMADAAHEAGERMRAEAAARGLIPPVPITRLVIPPGDA